MEPAGSAPAAASACVTLRLPSGERVWVEAVAAEGGGGRGVVEEAVALAMAEAERRAPVSRDALWDTKMREYGSQTRLSLELGGLPVPVDVESFEDAAMMVSPGVAGVGARVGTGDSTKVALVFPSAMLGAGMDAGSALGSAAAEVLEDASAPLAGAGAVRERGVRFLAFETVWVAESPGDRTAMLLDRGGRVFETRDVSTAMARDLGVRLADLLGAGDAGPEDGPGGGPSGGEAGGVGSGAASFENALRAYALARWARTPTAGTPEQADAWLAAAADMFAGAGAAMEGASPAAAALWIMVDRELPAAPPGEGDDRMTLARGQAGQVMLRALAAHEEAPPAVAAMLAWAGAWRGGSIGDLDLVERADAALRSAYARTPSGEWVSLMPWAGWADLEIAGARRRLAGVEAEIAGAAGLREARDLVWRHQVNPSDVMATDRDLVGGIVFTRGRQPLPTWHSLRPVALLATMMGDRRLTAENEFPGQVLRLLGAIRFLRQLCADDAVMAWSDGPAWGVRAATWTDEQPAEATPLGLLVLAEFVRSVEAERQRRAGAGG